MRGERPGPRRGGKMAARLSGGENRLVSLPLSRIRVIMKSSPEVSSINQDALFLTAKATELFVQYLASYSYKHGRGKEKNALTYSDLSHTAEECETFQFLAGISPVLQNYTRLISAQRIAVSISDMPTFKSFQLVKQDLKKMCQIMWLKKSHI
uniref:Chromatin accessibility complex protein 1 n=1 Tax=Gallus gallus TaxID=9031 RepID=A0A8V0XVG9_CHICK